MNSNKAISEIKKLMVQFGFLPEDKVEEPTLLDFKLEDNTILRAEKIEVGKKITKINEEFESVSLEDGTYKIENFDVEVKDGEIVSVSERFLDAKLQDGSVIKVEGDAIAVGARVMVSTEEGDVPAPDGEYILEDGSKVRVEGSVVAEIESAEEPVEEVAPEEEVPAEMATENNFETEVYEMLKDFITSVNQRLEVMESKFNKVSEDFESFKKEPATKKVSDGKTDFNKETTSEDSRVKAIMELRRANNK